ncbi:MAG: hypothetical protein FWE13_01850 [Firmicutes bacterium]|nr:hypothetical protein [Bacillota bacterium]
MTNIQKQLIKKLEGFAFKKDIRDIFNEAVEFNALKWALMCDIFNAKHRQQKQKEILNRYSKNDILLFQEICHDIES